MKDGERRGIVLLERPEQLAGDQEVTERGVAESVIGIVPEEEGVGLDVLRDLGGHLAEAADLQLTELGPEILVEFRGRDRSYVELEHEKGQLFHVELELFHGELPGALRLPRQKSPLNVPVVERWHVDLLVGADLIPLIREHRGQQGAADNIAQAVRGVEPAEHLRGRRGQHPGRVGLVEVVGQLLFGPGPQVADLEPGVGQPLLFRLIAKVSAAAGEHDGGAERRA